jgi:hypothetical protein
VSDQTKCAVRCARGFARATGLPVCVTLAGRILPAEPLTGRYLRVSPLGSVSYHERESLRGIEARRQAREELYASAPF